MRESKRFKIKGLCNQSLENGRCLLAKRSQKEMNIFPFRFASRIPSPSPRFSQTKLSRSTRRFLLRSKKLFKCFSLLLQFSTLDLCIACFYNFTYSLITFLQISFFDLYRFVLILVFFRDNNIFKGFKFLQFFDFHYSLISRKRACLFYELAIEYHNSFYLFSE